MEITIPHNFQPRSYQIPLFRAIDNGILRGFCLWHRRAGKDKSLFNLLVKKAFEKKGIYYYFFPKYAQGRKILWEGIDRDGFKFLDHVPEKTRKRTNDQEMKIELVNGSIVQIIGTDNYDSIRGTNPIGCVFSEYAYQNPMAWEVVRPILAENGGWAVFNTTPNGKNHSYDLHMMARDNKDWFCEVLTVDNTKRPSGEPVIGEDVIREERYSGMSEEMIQQEYFCSYDVGALGAYYSDQMRQAWSENRILELPFYMENAIDVNFDLGISDSMSLWFSQRKGEHVHFINSYENSNKILEHYCEYIDEYLQEKRAKLGTIYVPHDASKRDIVTGKTVLQELQKRYGSHKVKRVEIASIKVGIQAVRSVLPKCKFDEEACKQGIRALENYHKEWDDVKKIFKDKPDHDWSSHFADSFRCFAMSYKPPERLKRNAIKACKSFNS